MKRLDPTKKHIGLVRYADHYDPTNEKSQTYLAELMAKVGIKFFTTSDKRLVIPRLMRRAMTDAGSREGYVLHFFEKGLGR